MEIAGDPKIITLFVNNEYKTLTLKLPAVTWEQLLDGLEIEQRAAVLGQVKSPEVSVDKRSLKAAMDVGVVPGAGFSNRAARVGEALRVKPVRLPLCVKHHRTGNDSYHRLGPRKFAEVHQLNIPAIVTRLSAKPCIRVESGAFVGRFGDQEYELGSTEGGLAQAIRRMSQIRWKNQAEVA